jgi:alpha-D-xyloside xylohydrolase
VSAPGFWSHDIGGFFGPELTPGLYIRWTQLGALSPLMRAHGLRPREPWQFGSDALEISRRWVRLRYELLPYLWQVAHESARHGWPVMRPLGLEFPDDPVARSVDDSFLLGSDLLVVPIFDDGTAPVTRRFYVPEGTWVDLVDGTTYSGPGFHRTDVPLDRLPVLVRSGAVVPRVEVDSEVTRTADLADRAWILHAYGECSDELELIGFDGTSTRVALTGSTANAAGTQAVAPVVVRHDG